MALVGFAILTAEAQIFGEGGLFNRNKKDSGQNADQIGVPTPRTGKVEALKGHEVTFEIMADSKTPGATVEFLIRTFPSAGRIVSMVGKPSERNKALVTYHADPNSGATEDAFAFAVRYRGGRYSSVMRYDISLVDHKSEIMVTEGLDFGEVMIGDESIKDIVVMNSGDGTFSRRLFVGAPWHILDPPGGKLVIGPNGRRTVRVAFRPELSGETSYFLGFSRSKRGTTKLKGKGKPSFELVNQEVELVMNEETNQREGELLVMNHSKKPLRIEADASSRLKWSLNEAYLLAPEKETSIPISLAHTDTSPFDGSVQFRMKTGYVQTAKVVAKVVPAQIEVTIPGSLSSEVINFGKVQGGRSVERQITVTNLGGLPVPLEFHIPEPFRLLTNPRLSLGAMSSVNLSLGLYPPSNYRGPADGNMKVYANAQSIPIRLLGNVIKPEGGSGNVVPVPSTRGSGLSGFRLSAGSSNADSNTSLAPPAPVDSKKVTIDLKNKTPQNWYEDLDEEVVAQLTSKSGRVGFPVVSRNYKASLRSPEDLSLLEMGSDTVTIGWTAPKDSELCTFEVEVLSLMAIDGSEQAFSVWAPYTAVNIERIGRLVKAELKDLVPASYYEIRVFMVDENKRSSATSEIMEIQTEKPLDWTYIYIVLGLAAMATLGFGIYRVVKAREPEVYESKYADL